MISLVKNLVCLALLVMMPWAYVASVDSDMRLVEVRVTDHQAGIEDFRKLGVRLQSVAIHTKGSPRREGWISLDRSYPLIDIVPLKNGRYASTGMFDVPMGKYDAVKVDFLSVEGDLHTNEVPKISADNTIVATTIDLTSDAQVALVLDLYVESQTDHEDNLYILKVKEIRVE